MKTGLLGYSSKRDTDTYNKMNKQTKIDGKAEWKGRDKVPHLCSFGQKEY